MLSNARIAPGDVSGWRIGAGPSGPRPSICLDRNECPRESLDSGQQQDTPRQQPVAEYRSSYSESQRCLDTQIYPDQSCYADQRAYPDPQCTELRRAVASLHGTLPDRVVVGAGSLDVIIAAWRTAAAQGDSGVFAWPGFEIYPLAGIFAGAANVAVPLAPDLSTDLAGMVKATLRSDARVVAVANPHNPTGTTVSRRALLSFLDSVPERVLVIVDEAYIEYSRCPDASVIDQAIERPNLLVTRTFSKAYGLAGVRCGYGVGQPALVAAVSSAANPFGVAANSQRLATEALRHQAIVERRLEKVREDRSYLHHHLNASGYEPVPSEANFIYVPTKTARQLAAHLYARGIAVWASDDGIRITVGTRVEIDALLAALPAPSAAGLPDVGAGRAVAVGRAGGGGR